MTQTEKGLKIEYRPICDLIPYARNARTHSESQIDQIISSIKEFGWTNPILIDGQNGIIAGHGRILAAQKMAIDNIPCIELSGLSDVQKKAYIIADNKLALNAGWDSDLLRIELTDLKDLDFDLDIVGFDGSELADAIYGKNINCDDGDDFVPHADGNILIKMSIPSSVWLGKRNEIMKIFERMEKTYLSTTRVDE
jgi:hypothetical protein